MTLGGGLGGGGGDLQGRAEGSRRVEREGRQQFDAPTYSVSVKSVLIVVLVLLAIIVGAIVIFT